MTISHRWLGLCALALCVGLLALPGPAFAATVESPSRSGCAQWYQVRWGDQLRFIAPRYGTTWQALARLNGLPNADRLYAGMWLCVQAAAAAPPGPSPLPPRSGCAQWYQVRWGDQLRFIAPRYGTTWQTLAQLNGLRNANRIYAGTWLCVGAGAGTPPASGSRYVVQPGDNLTRISRRFGVSLERLIAANGIRNPYYIFSGQVLVIPPR